jgi:hypothetical protein
MPPHRSNEIRAMIFSHQLDRQALIEASMAGPDKAECSTCAVPSRAQSCKAGHGLPAPKAAISLVTCVSGRFVGRSLLIAPAPDRASPRARHRRSRSRSTRRHGSFASITASRRSVLTRSPDFIGISEGASGAWWIDLTALLTGTPRVR